MIKPFGFFAKSIFFTTLLSFLCFSSFSQSTAPEEAAPPAEAAAPANDNGIPTDAEAIANGMSVFQNNCQQCHKVHERLVGPALANVWERQPVEWLINFIKYPQRVIDGGDPYAEALYKEYQQYMPNHDFLSDEEILNVLAYVQDETIKGPAAATGDGGGTTVDPTTPVAPVNTTLLLAIIIGLVTLLIIVVAVMLLLVATLTRYIRQEKELSEEEQEYLDQKFSLGKVIRSQAFIGIVALIFVALAGKATVDGLFSIGVQQGYAPDQPIKFSHKLHAGYYEIDCQYCHTGVLKSKSANIPSANICMNCHNAIKTNSPEIQKIYTAIENDEPIQWVRVHNLPDLAYFNHAQHVNVGNLECQTCHGEIQEMEVVQQHSLLTMGWCIDCHRKTELNTRGNEYYDKLVKLHESTSKKAMVVEDIGGLECAKCHY